MKKYSFPQFKVEIIDPTIENVSVNDNISRKQCDVSCVLNYGGNLFGINIGVFIYKDTWEDSEIIEFIETELKKYLIK